MKARVWSQADRFRSERAALVLTFILLVSGCETLPEARMELPGTLGEAAPLAVVGRQGSKLGQELRFGEYFVYDVQRGMTRGGDLRILAYDQSRRRQLFSFRVNDDEGNEWIGDCETFARRRRILGEVEIELRNRSSFGARLFPAEGAGESWELSLAEQGERPLQGTLRSSWGELTVEETRRLEGSPLRLDEAAGFVVRRDGEAIAAAEVINDGAVWIVPDLDASLRGPVVSALSALLLWEELRGTLED